MYSTSQYPTATAGDAYRSSQISPPTRQPPYSVGSPTSGPYASGYASVHSHSQPHQSQHGLQRYPSAPNGYASQAMPSPPSSLPHISVASSQAMSPPAGSAGPGHHRTPKHKGTIPPGQLVRVGPHTVRVERYLSEGGYAHVYLTSSDKPIYPPRRGDATSTSSSKGRWGEKGYTEHCLKRIAFEDDSVWADVSKEIEVMKSLPISPYLIQYLDSAHTRTPEGKHEVFILMEFCAGGGIIDLLNKRLRDRLKEMEILNIFSDVCEAVAAMHALPTPLLHRDLKIENVLSHPLAISPTPQRPTPLIFKLCDFGSTTLPASHPPSTKAEADALVVDLNKHTTLQYRSPEMVEPMLGWAVGLPSDVWALGVLLYKLCYYTTPFEEHGPLAIVNAKYTFPQFPVYSPRLQHLIASMLVEHPARRPSVFEVLKVAHEMSGTRPSIDYAIPSRNVPAPLPSSRRPQGANVLDFTNAPTPQDRTPMQPLIPTVQPGRRGRPTRDTDKPLQTQPIPVAQSAPVTLPPPLLQVTGAQPQITPQPTFTGLQVTGPGGVAGDERRPAPSHATSLDAFGLPTTTKPRRMSRTAFTPSATGVSTAPTGFGDSFTAMSSTTAFSTSGFGDSYSSGGGTSDAFGVTPSVAATAARFGPSVRAGVGSGGVGFGDSFTGATSSNGPRARLTHKTSSSSSASMSFSPTQASQSPSSTFQRSPETYEPSAAEGDTSFEQRYPSIESITSRSGTSTVAPSPSPGHTPAPSATPAPASVTARPYRAPRMSFAMTGGDSARNTHLPPPGVGMLPRSTQVTGTAFKSAVPGGHAGPTDSLRMEVYAPSNAPSPRMPGADLMADEDAGGQLAVPYLRPQLSNASSGGRFGISPVPTASGFIQPLTPSASGFIQPNKSGMSISGYPTGNPTGSGMGYNYGGGASFGAMSGSGFVQPQSTAPVTLDGSGLGAAQRATLPPMSTQRPATNMYSDQWSPLESMRRPRASSAATNTAHTANAAYSAYTSSTRIPGSPSPGVPPTAAAIAAATYDSSDDEEGGPENASGTGQRPSSPSKVTRSRSSTTGSSRAPPSPGIASRMSLFEGGAAPAPTIADVRRSPAKSTSMPLGSALPAPAFAYSDSSSASGLGSARPGVRHSATVPSRRPQSMYVSSTSTSPLARALPLTSSTTNARDASPAPPSALLRDDQSSRPGHARRSSINDMVSRYEALSTGPPTVAPRVPPKSVGNANGTFNGYSVSAEAGVGVTRKPSIAAKPPALRKPVVDELAPSRTRPAAPPVTQKPPSLRPAVKHGDMPAPTGYSRSSSGRSFPINDGRAPNHYDTREQQRDESTPRVSVPPISVPVSDPGKSSSSPPSSGSSPEKQQPVNLLIQRWNQGGVKGASGSTGSGGGGSAGSGSGGNAGAGRKLEGWI